MSAYDYHNNLCLHRFAHLHLNAEEFPPGYPFDTDNVSTPAYIYRFHVRNTNHFIQQPVG